MSNLLDFFDGLSSYKKGKIYYYPNNGNAGDALINMGFYSLAKKFNINFDVINGCDTYLIKDNDVILVAGGGCLVPEWDSTPNFVKKINNLDVKVKLVILPHSIREVDDIISNLPDGTIIFCREKYSYEYIVEKSNANEVYLENDIAFYADLNVIKNEKNIFSPKINYKNMIRKTFIFFHVVKSKSNKTVFAMRTDKESNSNLNIKRLLINDLSLVASFGAGLYPESLYTSNSFLELIDLYEEVHTDRLHVAIGACLLGKKVTVYNNGYYKCKGVYEQSMKQLPNVSFKE